MVAEHQHIQHFTSCNSKWKSETFLQAELLVLYLTASDQSYTKLELQASPTSIHHFVFPWKVYDMEKMTTGAASKEQITFFENAHLIITNKANK